MNMFKYLSSTRRCDLMRILDQESIRADAKHVAMSEVASPTLLAAPTETNGRAIRAVEVCNVESRLQVRDDAMSTGDRVVLGDTQGIARVSTERHRCLANGLADAHERPLGETDMQERHTRRNVFVNGQHFKLSIPQFDPVIHVQTLWSVRFEKDVGARRTAEVLKIVFFLHWIVLDLEVKSAHVRVVRDNLVRLVSTATRTFSRVQDDLASQYRSGSGREDPVRGTSFTSLAHPVCTVNVSISTLFFFGGGGGGGGEVTRL
ncbi:hypothetical protein PsorP6_013483 [Peronosclerospora sorghi]|uniref:Uncharacterized protein n=1 Tax=Peronosclerospora sorghi TaxID=230839 RepID=A0ACC0VH71_9STRA|nr:hypothetical protein PsorP6_013483 [Peronosclerospora sorghi]